MTVLRSALAEQFPSFPFSEGLSSSSERSATSLFIPTRVSAGQPELTKAFCEDICLFMSSPSIGCCPTQSLDGHQKHRTCVITFI